MLKLKRNMLFMALASATLMVSAGAYAQNADDQDQTMTAKEREAARKAAAAEKAKEMDVVEVTGIRRGIESAISIKQESTSIIEAVSAEDIGKLPDSSIAESIARLPGLAAQRVAGRATTISIRGLAGDFSTTLLNGREQVSSGDNRSVEFDQYPSELLNQVVIYKTPDANLVAQGISGTVDLQTVRPLAFGKRVVSVNGRYEKNSVGEVNPGYDDTGYRLSASYIDQFADNTIGLAIGFARLDSPGQAERWNAWGYPTDTVGGQANTLILGGSESFATSTSNVRDGLMAVLEWQPSENYNGALDLYYSKFERVETTRGLQTGLHWSGAPLTNAVVEDGLVVAGTYDGVRPVLRNDRNKREDDIFAIGFKNEFTFNEYWTGMADFSHSKANRDESILETYAGAAGSDIVNFTLNRRTGLPNLDFGIDYADPNVIQLRDPGGWGQDGYIKYPKFEDKLDSARFSLTRSLDSEMFSSFDFGSNWSKRSKSRAVAEAFLDLANNRQPLPIPSNILQSAGNLSFTGIPGTIAYSVPGAFNLYTPRTNINQDILNKDWEVNETVITSYFKLNIDGQIGDIPVRGNLGIQYVNADQESEGFAVPGGNATQAQPFKGGKDYNDVLPSLNLIFSLTDEQSLRVGVAKQLARPRMDQMRANNGFGIDTTRGEWSGGGGNPELEPWRATSFDLSYEYYLFGGKGYVSAAGFHKDLKNYIYDQGVDFDFSVFDLSGFTGQIPTSTIGRFTRPVNGEGGSINGWELALSLPFGEFVPMLDGFGMLGSYSDTRSGVRPQGPGTSQPLPGLSRYVSNITLYYEKYGFSTRVSQRSRSSFIGEIQGFGADRETRYVEGEDLIDFQAGYSFSGDLDGLTVLLQVNNVTNEAYRETFRDPGTPDRPRSYNEYGRTYLLGASYKF
ncbi:MAG: TonB-dependent receptor [Xanthomonadales bacterium]|nr:TonB-dependent receptor [Xanthomonadales bacterium]